MKKLCFILALSFFCTLATFAKDLVRAETVNDSAIVGSLLNALEYAQELDEAQNAGQLLNQMLVVTALAQAAPDELSEDAEQRALSILSAISNEVTAASSLLDETLAARIETAITVVSAEVTVDRTPPSDIIIEGQRAERIIQEGTILANDSFIEGHAIAIQYLLVDYGEHLYACVHSHSPNAREPSWVISVSCARDGDDS
ncbi:hypothetical protein FZCC0069_08980 [Rhodobacterales bacterium FZCC0069]|nr:hypothetical protein [Rhodobacterales bacterium FZCC0069]